MEICNYVYNGRKSSTEGIDLEFETDNTKYIVSIKSGPNWGNSSQIKKMKDNFKKAKRILGTTTSTGLHVIAVNGCCYGKVINKFSLEFMKMFCDPSGEILWEEVIKFNSSKRIVKA
ncbi:MAG: PmeII family type II restriction endonuclease [Thermodesulfobacteriota bacterium]|nr:PmeII family type II restriction endonuclease [Thermodesulfobacteriota bacterium]